MNKIVRRIEDIPEDIYSEIPIVVYKFWNKQFVEIHSYANQITNKKFNKPINGTYTIHSGSNKSYHIMQSKTDELKLTYIILYRIQAVKLKKLLNEFMKSNNFDFDFDLFNDKDKLLKYISKKLSDSIGFKMSISIDCRYATFATTILLKTKSDIIEM